MLYRVRPGRPPRSGIHKARTMVSNHPLLRVSGMSGDVGLPCVRRTLTHRLTSQYTVRGRVATVYYSTYSTVHSTVDCTYIYTRVPAPQPHQALSSISSLVCFPWRGRNQSRVSDRCSFNTVNKHDDAAAQMQPFGFAFFVASKLSVSQLVRSDAICRYCKETTRAVGSRPHVGASASSKLAHTQHTRSHTDVQLYTVDTVCHSPKPTSRPSPPEATGSRSRTKCVGTHGHAQQPRR